MNLSYTIFSNIQCPIKFYIIKALCKKEKKSIKTEVGICIHEIYKKAINNIIEFNTIDTSFAEKFVAEKFPQIEFDRIRSHISLDFLRKIHQYLLDGYNVKVEKSSKLSTYYRIFNEYLKLYTKPDVVCTKNDEVHIIDIKTGFFEDIDQLLYYLWSECYRNKGLTKFKGYVYNSKWNSFDIKITTNRVEILEQVHAKINALQNLYRTYDIKSFAEFATFIDNENIDSKTLVQELAKAIKDTSCTTCRFNNICPAYLHFEGCWDAQFVKTKSSSEKILYFASVLSAESSRNLYAEI